MYRNCVLSPLEKRIYCAKKRASNSCLKPWFLGYRCPYLEWSKLDVMREAQNGRKVIVSKSGFSEEAVEYIERYRPNLRLVHEDKTIKPRSSGF